MPTENLLVARSGCADSTSKLVERPQRKTCFHETRQSRGRPRAEVQYGEPMARTYRDLWVITLDPNGRCTAFEEWPFFLSSNCAES